MSAQGFTGTAFVPWSTRPEHADRPRHGHGEDAQPIELAPAGPPPEGLLDVEAITAEGVTMRTEPGATVVCSNGESAVADESGRAFIPTR